MKKKSSKKIIIRIILGIVLIAGILFAVYKLAFDPYRGSVKSSGESLPLDERLTVDRAIEDIDYVMKIYRQRHPAWLEDSNARVDDVEKQYVTEVDDLRSSGVTEISVLEEWKIISRIMHCLYDGHSTVFHTDYNTHYLSDFTQINKYGLPVMIGNEPYEDVLNRFMAVYQYETESYAKAIFDSKVIVNENYLRWCGIDTTGGIDYTFETDDGNTESFHYDFVPLDQVAGREEIETEDRGWVYYEIDKENSIGIFTLTSCEYNDEYRKTVKSFFEAVKEAGTEHIIIDLRGNGGGSSLVGDEFLKYCNIDGYYGWPSHVRFGPLLIKNKKYYIKNKKQEPLYNGDLYVLTNRRTFSAAMDFTMYVMDNDLGIVVGEESGNLPDSYGDTISFQTPNARLNITMSYKRWFRIDETKSGQPLVPDYPCPSSEAMDKAYEIILTH